MDVISYSKAKKAETKADNVQTQLDQAVADGDQLAETQQARVDEEGTPHSTLKERIDTSVDSLKQKDEEINSGLVKNKTQVERVSSGYENKRPIMSIISDDGDLEDFTKLKPLLDSKGIKASVAVIPTRFGQSYAMSVAQVKQLESEGWEVMAHSEINLTTIDLLTADQELRESKEL